MAILGLHAFSTSWLEQVSQFYIVDYQINLMHKRTYVLAFVSFMTFDGQNSMHKGIFSFKHKSHVGKITTFRPPSLSKYILTLAFSGVNSFV
jgi:hypothetical protein